MSSYDKYDYVVAIAEEQNITKAAARLYISQPALTSAINRLEAELGVKLFDRRSTPVRLTPAGSFYIQEMPKIRDMKYKMEQQLRSFENGQTRLTIGMGRGRSLLWFPKLLAGLRESHPDIEIVVKHGNYAMLESLFQEQGFDITFGSLNLSQEDVVKTWLSTEHLIYAVPKSLHAVNENSGASTPSQPILIKPSDLDGKPFICTEPGSSFHRYLSIEMEHYGFTPSEITYVDNPSLMHALAENQCGIIFFVSEMLNSDAARSMDRMHFCTLSELPPEKNIYAYYHQNSPKMELIQETISILQETVIPAAGR